MGGPRMTPSMPGALPLQINASPERPAGTRRRPEAWMRLPQSVGDLLFGAPGLLHGSLISSSADREGWHFSCSNLVRSWGNVTLTGATCDWGVGSRSDGRTVRQQRRETALWEHL
jgi:hypothetical protein